MLEADRDKLLEEWLAEGLTGGSAPGTRSELAQSAKGLLEAVREGAIARGEPGQFEAAAWSPVREALATLSAARAAQGVSAGDTSMFISAMKKPLFSRLQERGLLTPEEAIAALWWVSRLVDKMTQFAVTTYQSSREDIIERQQQELLELSTPVIKLWDGVLAVPMIGTLDSSRTQW